ncbi:MAG: DUF1385 domain-containing protein [Nitrospirae bacterium]|nr:DUF1385 domain-containing protein [Nitrospirota bacterium]
MKIGGQAVIEGVMMKSDKKWSVAVRNAKGEIVVKDELLTPLPKLLKLPIIRGVVALFQAVTIGVKALNFSASTAYDEEETLSPLAMAATIGSSFLLAVLLFILMPLYLTKVAGIFMSSITNSSLVFNLVDGIIRVAVFLIYIVLIGLWKEMSRVFEYHGAEHKVIYAYEAGNDLTVENAKKFSTLHPRCGTSFIFIVMILSILIFSFIPKYWAFYLKFGSRVVLIPLIAGMSYEILRLSAKFKSNPIIRFLIKPGLMLQMLTTKQPSAAQMEVALTALKQVMVEEQIVA